MTRVEEATNHVNNILERFSNEISYSISNTVEHRGDIQISNKEKSNVMTIKMVDMDTVSAIFKYHNGKTAALNFASYKNPGGGFIKGYMAQEEALCHKSTLYPVLLSHNYYYDRNKGHLIRGLYTDAALYSNDILFMSETGNVKCDVITCASPNWGAARRNGVSRSENTKVLKERIEFVLKVAALHDVDTLILGAWGCGVFKQNPNEVAVLFQNALQKYPYFSKVIFAVPRGINFDSFKSVFWLNKESY